MATDPDEHTITHFTSTLEALKGILSVGFKLKACKETILIGNVKKEFRVPMVCFCDIPISDADQHMRKYGRYAVGLTEEWARAKGLSPVSYIPPESDLAKSKLAAIDREIEGELQRFFSRGKTSPSDLIADALNDCSDPQPLMDVLNDMRYLKNHRGRLERANGEITEEYWFKSENEWRYALPTGRFSMFFYAEEMFKFDWMVNLVRGLLEDEKLLFSASDVRYLLIEKEDDQPEVESHIHSLTECFNEKEMAELISKIVLPGDIEASRR